VTREQKIEMFTMRIDGMTLEEIGGNFGLTRERVRQILTKATTGRSRKVDSMVSICAFPLLGEYLAENEYTPRKFGEMLWPPTTYITQKARRRLSGETPFTVGEWKKISEVTGLPLEQLMKEKEIGPCAGTQEANKQTL